MDTEITTITKRRSIIITLSKTNNLLMLWSARSASSVARMWIHRTPLNYHASTASTRHACEIGRNRDPGNQLHARSVVHRSAKISYRS